VITPGSLVTLLVGYDYDYRCCMTQYPGMRTEDNLGVGFLHASDIALVINVCQPRIPPEEVLILTSKNTLGWVWSKNVRTVQR